MPVARPLRPPTTRTIDPVRIPGITQMLAGESARAPNGTNVDAVYLRSSRPVLVQDPMPL
jgi:hypothetical protein